MIYHNTRFLTFITIALLYLINIQAKPQKIAPQAAEQAAEVQSISSADFVVQDPSEVNDQQQSYFLYLTATYQHAVGKIVQSLQTFQTLLEIGASPHAYQGFFQVLFDVGQFNTLVSYYEKNKEMLETALADNVATQLLLAQAYLQLNQDEKAEPIFARLSEKNPDNEHVAYFATISLIKNKQFDKALAFVDKCLENQSFKQKHFLFHFLKSKVLVQQNKNQEALTHIEKSLEHFPRFDHGWLFRAVLLEQMGRLQDAIGGYKKFLDLVGRDVTVEKQLIQLLFSQQRFSEALSYLKRMKANTADYFFDMGLLEYKSGKYTQALTFLDQALTRMPTFAKAKLLKIEVLINNKQLDKALENIKLWLTQDPKDLSMLHTLLLLRTTHIKTPAVIKLLQDIVKNKPHEYLLAALADLYTEANDQKRAAQCYQNIIAVTKDPDLKSKTLFHLGYFYFTTKQAAKLETTLKQALSTNPVYPSTYNLLAYLYASNNKNLDTALNFVNQALKTAPDCYYYLDTKGLILLKLGKKSDALAIFKQALEKSPGDTIIMEHIKQASN